MSRSNAHIPPMKVFSVILGLTFVSLASAHVGSIDEAIQAAREEREPNYIKEMMALVSPVIANFAHGTQNCSDRGAFLLAMRSVLNVLHAAAKDASAVATRIAYLDFLNEGEKYFHLDTGFRTARRAAKNSAFSKATYARWIQWENLEKVDATRLENDDLWIPFGNQAEEDAEEIAETLATEALAHGESVEIAGSIAYRAAEWSALNYFLLHAPQIIEASYSTHLANPARHLTRDLFETQVAGTEFDANLGDADHNPNVFLTPWLSAIVQRSKLEGFPISPLVLSLANDMVGF